MAADLVQIILELRNVRQFTSGADRASKSVDKIGDSAEKSGKKAKRGWTGIAKWGASAGIMAAAGVALKGAVTQASDLNESVNAVNVTFGKAAPTVQAFSKKAVDEAGLSMQNFNKLVVPVGAMLQNLGYSEKQAAKESINLAKRAADMASVYNVSVPEAMEAIQSGLRGEADPLERFGVGLKESAVTAHALAMGLAKNEKALTPQMKAQARVALLYKQSNKVAGDFKNTSGGLANQQRILRERYANIQAQLGTALLPTITAFVGLLNKLASNSTALKIVLVLLITAFVAYQIAVIAATIAQMTFNMALLITLGWILLVIAALVAIGIAAYFVIKHWDWIKKKGMEVWGWIKKNWPYLLAVLLGPFALAAVAIYKNWSKIKQWSRDLIDFVIGQFQRLLDFVKAMPGKIAGFLKGKAGSALGWATSKIPGGQFGAHVQRPGTMLVGEGGPELLSVPGGATVTPLGAGIGAGGPLVVKTQLIVDRQVLAEAVSRHTADKLARR